jgi:hypothetical protein
MRFPLSGAALLRAFALATLTAGCSSTGSAVPSYNTATSTPAQTASVTFTVETGTAPASSGRSRRPDYLSPATQSVSIVPVVTGSPNQKTTIIDLGAGVAGCTGSGASLSCSGTVTAPVGETSFTVTTYSAQNAQGSVLSVGTITVDVKASSTGATISNATSLTLSGVPASFTLAAPGAALTIGTPSSLTAVVTAYDAAGSAIIGPAQYTTGIDVETITPFGSDPVLTSAQPVLLSVPGCTYPTKEFVTTCHIVTVASTPADAITLEYAGEFVSATSILLVGESPGLKTQQVAIPLATPAPGACTGSPIVVCPGSITFANALSSPVPLTVTESGVSTFNASAVGCVNEQIASINFSQEVSGDSFTVDPGAVPGQCTASISDASGNTTNINIALLAAAPSPSPSPTVAPTASPTPVPTGPINIAPSNTLEFTSSTAAPQQITASEPGITTFTIDQSACGGIVTVTPPSGATFTIAPVASLTQGGVCTFNVLDPSGQSSPVKAYVDGVIFHVNSYHIKSQ